MTDSNWDFLKETKSSLQNNSERTEANVRRFTRTKEDDSAAVVLMQLAFFPTRIILRDGPIKDEEKIKEVRLANACQFHKRKHQKCPSECIHRHNKKSRKQKEENDSSEEEDKSTKPSQQI